MPRSLQFSRLLLSLCLVAIATVVRAHTSIPVGDGDRSRYNVQIDFNKAYISGMCVMVMENETIKAGVFNEFGVSALSFSYNQKKDKVKILSAMKQINKWYIKKVLRHDLREVMHRLKDGDTQSYQNARFNITYNFSPLQDDSKE